MKKTIPTIIVILIIIGFLAWRQLNKKEELPVTNFEECVAVGNLVMESYPRQCRHKDQTFTEELSPQISREEALGIAQESKDCSDAGVLTDRISYNGITKTWWIDLERFPELEKDGCNPACVVWEDTKTAEVNWRCTGVLL
ncbi:MAG: hypothetical protein ABIG40_02095 [Parcubacteria group bacterium]